MLDLDTFGSDKLSTVFVSILNAREESLRKKICRLLYAFERKMISLQDISDRKCRQYFYQLLYDIYRDSARDLCGSDEELVNFTLNFITKLYRKNFA
jgi:hypothetical protein